MPAPPHLGASEARFWRQVFDIWRQNYDEWPYASHQRFYNMVARTFPSQRKADGERVKDALDAVFATTDQPINVWELGGWDGELAKEMIEACGNRIAIWANTEICTHAIRHGWSGDQDVYIAQSPRCWVWDLPSTYCTVYNIAILSHVIEHLSWRHLRELLQMLCHIPLIYIQTPDSMGDEPHLTGWMGTMSTHKLEVGWTEVKRRLETLGYTERWHKDQGRLFAKAHHST